MLYYCEHKFQATEMDKENSIHASVAAEPEEEERKSLACSIIVQEVVSDSE